MPVYKLHSPYTLKNTGLKTTQIGLFPTQYLVQYRTEHMLGCFDFLNWVEILTQYKGLLRLTKAWVILTPMLG